MSKLNIKKEHGFTIVELLVVIVVIGILAAITIVSYTGITTRANTAKALSNANSIQSVAEAYAADVSSGNGYYPATTAAFANGTIAKKPAGLTIVVGQGGTIGTPTGTEALTLLSNDLKTSTFSWACTTSNCTNATGGKIDYWDFTDGRKHIYVGDATSASTFYAPAS